MKKVIALVVAVVLIGLYAVPVTAQSLQLSPASVQVDVPAGGSSEVEFYVFSFTGELEIDLENIPLTVEPEKISVNATAEGTRVVLTLYGDESHGSETYEGYIRFLVRGGGMVAMGIKVRATVNHIAEEAAFPAIPLVIGIVAAAAAAAVVLLRRRRSRRSSV
ncbi:MAG: hypothetical protein ACNA7X_01995 [Dehalococcoidia bacterium]